MLGLPNMEEFSTSDNNTFNQLLFAQIRQVEIAITELNLRITSLEKQDAVDEVHRTNVEKRLTGIEGTLQWLVRLVLGAIILGVTSFVISGGLTFIPV